MTTAPLAFLARLARVACTAMLGLALASCVSGSAFPSLALRPAELGGNGATNSAMPAAAASPDSAARSGDMSAQIVKLQAAARAAHARFMARRPAAERTAAAAGALGSESWAAASVALAGLEEAREQQSAALAEIDQLEVEAQIAGAGAQGSAVDAIVAAREAIAADAEADSAVLIRLRERLSR